MPSSGAKIDFLVNKILKKKLRENGHDHSITLLAQVMKVQR